MPLIEIEQNVERTEWVYRVGREPALATFAVDGATVYVRNPDGSDRSLFTKDGGPVGQPIKSVRGRLEAHVDVPDGAGVLLDLVVSKPGEIQTYTQRIYAGGRGPQGIQGPTGPQGPDVSGVRASLPINLKAYSAVGDGVADDTIPLQNAIAAVPTGGALFIPKGQYRVTSTINFDKQMSVYGEGLASCIWLNVGTAADGVVFNSPTGNVPLIRGVLAKDFSILGPANSCRNGLVIRNLGNSHFEDVYVRAGCPSPGWAVTISGCQVNYFNIITSANIIYPYQSGHPFNGIRSIHEDWPCNANFIDCQVEGAQGTGLLVDNATSASGVSGSQNHWITGTYEGIDGPGIHMVNGCQYWSLRDLHLETTTDSTEVKNALRIEGCQQGHIGPGIFVYARVQLVNSSDIAVDGVTSGSVTIDSACRRIRIGRLSYGYNFGTFTDSAPDTTYDGRMLLPRAPESTKAGRGPDDPHNLIANGNLAHWGPTGVPLGDVALGDVVVFAGTLTKTGTGQVDTRKFGGDYAAKMAGLNAELQARTSANNLERLIGRYVTSSVWVYIPSGQVTTPQVQIRHNVTGVGVHTGEQSSVVDQWHQLSITSLVGAAATALDLRLRNNAGADGNWYVADLAMVAGRVAPHHQAARVSPRRSASITYDPPSLADGAAAYTLGITVRGAKVGDPVLVGFTGTQVGMIFTGVVTAADTVRVTVLNKAGGVIDLASGTLRVEVLPL